MKLRAIKTDSGIDFPSQEDKDKYASINYGETIEIRGIDQRNVEHHRKFMKLIQKAWNNKKESLDPYFKRQPNFDDDFRKEIIKRAGFFSEYTDFKGNKQYNAKSMSFDNMGQKEFNDLYSACIDVIITWVIPDMDKETFEREMLGFL